MLWSWVYRADDCLLTTTRHSQSSSEAIWGTCPGHWMRLSTVLAAVTLTTSCTSLFLVQLAVSVHICARVNLLVYYCITSFLQQVTGCIRSCDFLCFLYTARNAHPSPSSYVHLCLVKKSNFLPSVSQKALGHVLPWLPFYQSWLAKKFWQSSTPNCCVSSTVVQLSLMTCPAWQTDYCCLTHFPIGQQRLIPLGRSQFC